jgi:hypothetical protein
MGFGTFNGSVTNISVKEVGQNWTLGTGWEIGNSVATKSGTDLSYLIQSSLTSVVGKTYNVKASITNVTTGNVRIDNFTSGTTYTSDTEVDVIYTATTAGAFRFLGWSGFDGTITNISVIEITDDTNLPRINYEGFSYQDALGSELVTNGDFSDGTNGWNAGGGASISVSNNQLTIEADNDFNFYARQSVGGFEVGKQYKIEIDVAGGTTSKMQVSFYGEGIFFENQPIVLGKLSAIITVTNGADGSRFVDILNRNDDGLNDTLIINNVSVKEYLGQEVVPDSGCGSWLFEPQSTNLITYSETLGNNPIIGGISFTYNNSISPDGTQNAALVSVTGANDRLQPSFAAVNGLVAISIFLKHDGTDFTTQLNTFNNGDATLFGAIASVTSTDVTFTSYQGGFDSASFVDYGNGWFRVIVVCQSTTGTTYAQWRPTTVTGALSYPCFGFQVEELTYATSYIPTEGTTVTRNQDVCINGGSLASINSTEGTLYFEGAALTDSGSNRSISISDGTNTNQIVLRFSNSANQITAYITDGGTITASLNNTLSNALNYNKIALKYKLNDVALWVNGVEVATDTNATMPSGFDVLKFSRADGANNFFAKTKALVVYKEALSDEELIELTTI